MIWVITKMGMCGHNIGVHDVWVIVPTQSITFRATSTSIWVASIFFKSNTATCSSHHLLWSLHELGNCSYWLPGIRSIHSSSKGSSNNFSHASRMQTPLQYSQRYSHSWYYNSLPIYFLCTPSPVYSMLLFKDAKSNDFHWQQRLQQRWLISINVNMWSARFQVCSSSMYDMHSKAWLLTVCSHWWVVNIWASTDQGG